MPRYNHTPSYPLRKINEADRKHPSVIFRRNLEHRIIEIVGLMGVNGVKFGLESLFAALYLPSQGHLKSIDFSYNMAPKRKRGFKRREDKWIRFDPDLLSNKESRRIGVQWEDDVPSKTKPHALIYSAGGDWEEPLTAYGLACGYCHEVAYNEDNILILVREPATNVYHVKGYIAGRHVWDSATGQPHAYDMFNKYAKMMRQHLAIQVAVQLGGASKIARGMFS